MDQAFADRYGPYALIAGASEGIGAAFARQVAERGVNLVLVSRRAEPLDALAREIGESTGVDVRTATMDLTSTDVDAQLAAVTDGLDVGLLVYNAGATHGAADFHDQPLDDALQMVRLNCVGPVVACHRFGAAMRERGRGGIILIGSMAGLAGSGALSHCSEKPFRVPSLIPCSISASTFAFSAGSFFFSPIKHGESFSIKLGTGAFSAFWREMAATTRLPVATYCTCPERYADSVVLLSS